MEPTPDVRKKSSFFNLLALISAVACGLIAAGVTGCSAPGGGGPGGACRTVANCVSDSAPICDAATLVCRGCTMNNMSDDTACRNRKAETPRCGPSGGCVACINSADCAARDPRKPTCQNYTCQPCSQASDCASNICAADGSCVPNTEVLFVDNSDGMCSSVIQHDGSEKDPICDLPEAIRKAIDDGRRFITVRPSSRVYSSFELKDLTDNLTLEISGAPTPAGSSKVVQILGGQLPVVSIAATTGKQLSLSLHNVTLAGSTFDNVVLCDRAATLRLSAVRILGGRAGVYATNGCILTIDGASIYRNTTGVYLNGSTFAITNSMVWRNDQTGIAIANGTGSVRFSTIYNNGASFDVPGIDCGIDMKPTIEGTILFNNERQMGTMKMLSPQVTGCTLKDVVTNDPRAMGGSLSGARYVSAIDFVDPVGREGPNSVNLRLVKDSAANRECCVDKATQTQAAERDIDGTRRPLGAAADVGAHEVQ
jgi:hypothetical protein